MPLRRQLLLISLVALCLPWAGCQYLREMDQVLRDSQSAALRATAQAVAARLAAEPELLRNALTASQHADRHSQVYVHPLPRAPRLDGYAEDWRDWPLSPRQFQHPEDPSLRMSLLAGQHNQQLYLLVTLDSPQLHYHHPGRPGLANGDHLLIAVNHPEAEVALHYLISASGPGPVRAWFRDLNGQPQPEYRLRGTWHERPEGYQVELQMPLALAQQGFALAAVSQGPNHPVRWLGTLDNPAIASLSGPEDPGLQAPVSGRLITPEPALGAALALFNQPGIRLQVADRQGWRLAASGDLAVAPERQPQGWLLPRLYRAANAQRSLPAYQDLGDGRILNPLLNPESDVHTTSAWLQDGQRHRVSAAAPIVQTRAEAIEARLAGTVLVESSSDQLLALTNSAFARLLGLTLATVFGLGLVLLGYASWLSWRIRRLNRYARRAVNPDGHINDVTQAWPQTRARDELGELARSYQQLLQRLQGYTEYLKTLAGKLSHELRTPLAVVRSSLDNLEHEPQSPQGQRYAERARSGAQRLSQLLSAMSEASRVEASIASAEREPVDLAQLLRDISAAYQDLYPQYRIHLQLSVRAVEPVQAAPELLVQMLDKLIDNAAGFCPPGGDIRLALNAEEPGWLTLSLANNGPLLPAQLQGQLFDSLVSARPAGGEQAHLGLGLYIVRLIAEYHGGSARAENLADANGVRFLIRIPRGQS